LWLRDFSADNFYIIEEGTLKACNLSAGESKYEDIEIGPGGFGGERAIMTGEPRAGDLVAQTDGQAFCIDKATFSNVLGDLEHLVTKSVDKTVLQGIKIFSDPEFEQKVYTSLANQIVNRTFKKGTTILKAGEKTDAALYLIRSGKVQEKAADGTMVVRERGGYFGHETMLTDANTGKNRAIDTPLATPDYTLTVVEDCVCGVLTLVSCRKVINTLYLGKTKADIAATVALTEVKFSDLKRHTILGAGTFGQVWLVSSEGPDGKRIPYALKVQSKYELIQDGQAKAVANEKNIMAAMNSPFLISLVNTYQDDKFVYMLLGLVQGGELYNVRYSWGLRGALPMPLGHVHLQFICARSSDHSRWRSKGASRKQGPVLRCRHRRGARIHAPARVRVPRPEAGERPHR
jgi:CRP-like cAMP-binding protein